LTENFCFFCGPEKPDMEYFEIESLRLLYGTPSICEPHKLACERQIHQLASGKVTTKYVIKKGPSTNYRPSPEVQSFVEKASREPGEEG